METEAEEDTVERNRQMTVENKAGNASQGRDGKS